jgi:hypothetical protein
VNQGRREPIRGHGFLPFFVEKVSLQIFTWHLLLRINYYFMVRGGKMRFIRGQVELECDLALAEAFVVLGKVDEILTRHGQVLEVPVSALEPGDRFKAGTQIYEVLEIDVPSTGKYSAKIQEVVGSEGKEREIEWVEGNTVWYIGPNYVG